MLRIMMARHLLLAPQARRNEGAGAGLGDAPAERDGNAFGKK
jgi:hypothetical protein